MKDLSKNQTNADGKKAASGEKMYLGKLTLRESRGQSLQKEFTSLFLTGKYTQKDIAKKLGIAENTAGRWVKKIQALKYFAIRKNLTNELEALSKKGYKENANLISSLITDIERIDNLIRKAKFIPHLTNQ